MSMVRAQINRAISLSISDRVIPEIRNIVSSMSSSGNRDTEASSSPNSLENRERTTGLKTHNPGMSLLLFLSCVLFFESVAVSMAACLVTTYFGLRNFTGLR